LIGVKGNLDILVLFIIILIPGCSRICAYWLTKVGASDPIINSNNKMVQHKTFVFTLTDDGFPRELGNG